MLKKVNVEATALARCCWETMATSTKSESGTLGEFRQGERINSW